MIFYLRSEFDDVVTPKAATGSDGHSRLHFASDPNPNSLPSYHDEAGQPQQHDSALLRDISGIGYDRFSDLIDNAMQKAHEAVVENPFGFIPSQMAPHTDNTKLPDYFETHGGTTGTIILYDNVTGMVAGGTKGDSPAFIILDDGKRVDAIKITTAIDGAGGAVTNTLNDPTSEIPVRELEYDVGNGPQYGPIDLRTILQHARDAGFDIGKLKMNLLACSDGLLKPYPTARDENGVEISTTNNRGEEIRIAKRYQKAKSEHPKNIAEGMSNDAIASGSYDNISAIMIEDIQQGKGKPAALVVCDGFCKQGYAVSQAATHAIDQLLTQERLATQTAAAPARSLGERIASWAQRRPQAGFETGPVTGNAIGA